MARLPSPRRHGAARIGTGHSADVFDPGPRSIESRTTRIVSNGRRTRPCIPLRSIWERPGSGPAVPPSSDPDAAPNSLAITSPPDVPSMLEW